MAIAAAAIRKLSLSAAAALALLAAPAAHASPDSDESGLRALQAIDLRVAWIGHRLALANADLCPRTGPLTGLVLHHLSQYGGRSRSAAARAFGLGEHPAVLAVVPGGAADRAGIRPGDVLLAADGRAFPADRAGPRPTFAVAERALDLLEDAAAAGPVRLRMIRGGEEVSLLLEPETGCASRFQAVPSTGRRARADGRYVQISSGLVAYAADDDELAAVLAHELAHNILEHRLRLREVGGRRNPRNVRVTEEEADRLSVWLLDRAGYSVEAPARFWERFRTGGVLFTAPTHPGWRQRARITREEAARMRDLQRIEENPVPPLMRAPEPTQ